jgi:hypothetical protein
VDQVLVLLEEALEGEERPALIAARRVKQLLDDGLDTEGWLLTEKEAGTETERGNGLKSAI